MANERCLVHPTGLQTERCAHGNSIPSKPGAYLVLGIVKGNGLRDRPYGLVVDIQGNLFMAHCYRIQKFGIVGNS